jgi:hypothetical protein
VKIVARTSKPHPGFFVVLALIVVAFCCGCGSKGTAASSAGGMKSPALPAAEPAEIPLAQQTEQKLDPLTKEDAELYLKVMRAAAERVKTPVPGDTATLDAAKKILAAGAAGRVPTRKEVMTLERANLVAIGIDQIVAQEMKLDGRTYRGIAEAIEAVVPNPDLGAASDAGSAPAPNHTLTPIEQRLSAVNARNEKYLASYRDEIQALIAVVHNPANLPR